MDLKQEAREALYRFVIRVASGTRGPNDVALFAPALDYLRTTEFMDDDLCVGLGKTDEPVCSAFVAQKGCASYTKTSTVDWDYIIGVVESGDFTEIVIRNEG